MKRLVCLFCAVLMAVCCIVSASADVIFEPNDSFYEAHREDCVRNERNYTAAGPNGDVTVYESPESDKVIATFANGETLYISYIYTDPDGIQWGYYENWETGVAGWVPMEYLELIYDGISFEEEFGHLFAEEEGLTARINVAALKTQPVFQLLQRVGNIPQKDMFATFNMGVGMTVTVAPEDVDEAMAILRAAGEKVGVIGEVVPGEEMVLA